MESSAGLTGRAKNLEEGAEDVPRPAQWKSIMQPVRRQAGQAGRQREGVRPACVASSQLAAL